MAGRRHHYSCRCNDCIRQRNGRRRRSADRYPDPLPAGAMWYEVPGDHPVRYQDDVSSTFEQFEQTARKWLEDAMTDDQSDRPQFPANDGDEDDPQPPADKVPELPRLEPLIHYQRDDMEREQEQLREFRRQQEERQRDWERRRDQIRTEQDAHERTVTEKPDGGMVGPPSGDDNVQVAAEQVPPAMPMPGTTPRIGSRRNILAPLIVSFLTLTVVVGIGLLVAYVVLSSPSETAPAEVVEPTRNLEATITAAVALAMRPAPLTPLPVAQPRVDDSSTATPIAAAPQDDQQSPVPTAINASPPSLPSDRLPTVECPGCVIPDLHANQHVEWVRIPKISENGVLAFVAKVDERAGFVVAGPNCGFANVTLTDGSGAFYGAIISHGMANACAGLPGDRIADHYQFFGNLLTVRLQIDPIAAQHTGLTLCLWTGGMTQEVLACEPVKQP